MTDDPLVEVDVRDHKSPAWYKVTLWNRGRERTGAASLCRLYYMVSAVSARYPKATKSSPKRPWREGMTIRQRRGGRVVFKAVPLVN